VQIKGGQPDKSGHVKRETLISIINHDFGLTINLEVKFVHALIHPFPNFVLTDNSIMNTSLNMHILKNIEGYDQQTGN
jgi:hypothetical protein